MPTDHKATSAPTLKLPSVDIVCVKTKLRQRIKGSLTLLQIYQDTYDTYYQMKGTFPPTHIIDGLLVATRLGEQCVASHVVLGTGGPVERRLSGNVRLMGALGPNAHQVFQQLGVAQSGGLVYDVQAIAVLAGDQCTGHRWLQLRLHGLQIVVDDRLVQIFDGILCGWSEVKEEPKDTRRTSSP